MIVESRHGARREAEDSAGVSPHETPGLHPLAVSRSEAARLVGVSASHVGRLIRAGKFPHLRVGARIVIPRKALAEWLEQNTKEAT